MNFSPCHLNTCNNVNYLQRSQTLQPIRNHHKRGLSVQHLSDRDYILHKYFNSLMESAAVNYANVPHAAAAAAADQPAIVDQPLLPAVNHHVRAPSQPVGLHNQQQQQQNLDLLDQQQPHHHQQNHHQHQQQNGHNGHSVGHHQRQASSIRTSHQLVPAAHHNGGLHNNNNNHQQHSIHWHDDMNRYYNIGHPYHVENGLLQPPAQLQVSPSRLPSPINVNLHNHSHHHHHHHPHLHPRPLNSIDIMQVCNELGTLDSPPAMPNSRRYTISRLGDHHLYKVPFPQRRYMRAQYLDPSSELVLSRGAPVVVLGTAHSDRAKFTVCSNSVHIDLPHQLTEPPQPAHV